MRLSSFAAVGVFTVGGALAPAVQANPGNPLTPAIRVATVPGQPYLAYASLASNPAGEFVVGWPSTSGFPGGVLQSYSPGTSYSAQAFDSVGHALSAPFPTIYDLALSPVLAADSVGGFTAAWDGYWSLSISAFARRFTLTGRPLTPETPVDSLVVDTALAPITPAGCNTSDVGTSPKGQFVVTMGCYFYFPPTSLSKFTAQIAVQRSFLPDGITVLPGLAPSSEFLAGLYPVSGKNGPVQWPLTAVAPNGSFVTAWSNLDLYNGASTIYVRRFNSLGLPLGPEAAVVPSAAPVYTNSLSSDGGLAGIASGAPGDGGKVGNYVLAWYAEIPGVYWQDQASYTVQGFDSSNRPLGPAVSLPTSFTYNNNREMAADAEGNFVIVSDDNQKLTAQFFLANGTARTGVITLPVDVSSDFNNSTSFAYQVSCDAAGNITVSWERYQLTSPQTAETVIYVQRFAGM